MSLGVKYNENITKSVCQSVSYVQAGKIINMEFTDKGFTTCHVVCEAQQQVMFVMPPTRMILLDKYCTQKGLKAPNCVCVFKMTLQQYTNYGLIHVIPDEIGNVGILYREGGHPLP